MGKRSVTAQWKKALLISTALLGGAAVSTVASQLVPAQQVLAASGRIAIWDDQSNSAYGSSTIVTNGNLLFEDIPSGYHAGETQDAGVSVKGNQFVIDTSVNGSGSYRVHVLPDDSSATTIGAFGVIYSRDSSSGRLIGRTTDSVTGSYILSIDVPEGYRPSADQDAGISVRGNQVLIDTQVNPSTEFYVNFDPIDGPTEETTAPTTEITTTPTVAPTAAPTVAPTTAPTSAPTAAPTTTPIETPSASGVLTVTDKSTGFLTGVKSLSSDDSYKLTYTLPNGYHLVDEHIPGISQSGNLIVIDTQLASGISWDVEIEPDLATSPTTTPTVAPTTAPTSAPTVAPTAAPTVAPTTAPTSAPTAAPTTTPTVAPTTAPTVAPTTAPTSAPTATPTTAPTVAPTTAPTSAPTAAPTTTPTVAPTTAPTVAPTTAPTSAPTVAPTAAPTVAPTTAPTSAPTAAPTTTPTVAPTTAPTVAPTTAPTSAPTAVAPTTAPTVAPTTAPTSAPTAAPTTAPTVAPTAAPTVAPTSAPTATPTSTSTATTRPVPVAVTKAIDSSASTVKSKPNTIAAKSEEQRFPETGEENNSGTALAGLALLTTATASLFGISMKRKRRN
ncbi:LPXTG cell wall anchor domain-containing protein [Lactiplantibacillus pentosus]|uniref:LPXTG cell wall anchor domain-containing protein n=1 Tax=Lactiplantibacillus pentosus TaxID=1589 RepID=UPI001C1EAEFA|nr:LPXTG cell wall anchor domain-containing protein [Lactiplantibacillus pentosus]MBU7495182.1 LPXTG cell wall anchor domain-containing protein [Lactiplantibacillus pentosus]MBU7521159.1 LPXTG cell wall anchor domain-containing protein [Lactiplantibacillus pentosus]